MLTTSDTIDRSAVAFGPDSELLVLAEEFDFAEIDARLGWSEESENRPSTDLDASTMAAAMVKLLRWIGSTDDSELLARKFVAVHHALDPQFYGGKSMAELARERGDSKQSFAQFLKKFRLRTGIQPITERDKEARAAMVEGSREAWRRRREKALPPDEQQQGDIQKGAL